MFGDVFLEFIELVGVKQVARVIGTWFDLIDRKLEQQASGYELWYGRLRRI